MVVGRIVIIKAGLTLPVGPALLLHWSWCYGVGHLKVKKVRRGYIVVNTKTGIHAHFRSAYGCYCIKIFIREGIVPDNSYLKESYRRLTMEKPKYKERYININKGFTETYD